MILVVNAGSSSIKFKLYKSTGQAEPTPFVEGLAERITVDGALTLKIEGIKKEYNDKMPNHEAAVQAILNRFQENNVIKDVNDIKGVGFRIVHGGVKVVKPVVLDATMKKVVEDNIKLAPLHNPGALTAINAFEKNMPNAKLVGCFDTSFHQTMPPKNYLYPIPYEWFEEYSARKYGFHGISFDYITQKTAKIINKPVDKINLIICHLGNGASLCCVKAGKSFDTSMGLTPLAGIMMGTRTGDIDPSLHQYIAKQTGLDLEQITDILNKKSGLLGISGISSDMRDITAAVEQNNQKAALTLDMWSQRIADFIVKYANLLEGKVDAIILTAGVGENSRVANESILDKVKILNIKYDDKAMASGYDDYIKVSSSQSQYEIYKIRTDEELMICNETLKFLK
ncbi:acetate kinase [Spiroplasma clarkii]|uniref:Acetate kinase n=1 Tax=Spiroplasma clarkii TaxID=2139 RepID=A0A2K8KH60_9MOLU|nr:acetate kinase [Spiroplasma clarkii]ATX70572.1 acetate kinase [Spiroplasma clarkii]